MSRARRVQTSCAGLLYIMYVCVQAMHTHMNGPLSKRYQQSACAQAAQKAALDAIEGQQEAAEAVAPNEGPQDGSGMAHEAASPQKRVRAQASGALTETIRADPCTLPVVKFVHPPTACCCIQDNRRGVITSDDHIAS